LAKCNIQVDTLKVFADYLLVHNKNGSYKLDIKAIDFIRDDFESGVPSSYP